MSTTLTTAKLLHQAGSPERAQLFREISARLLGPIQLHIAGTDLAQAMAIRPTTPAEVVATPLVAQPQAELALLGAHAVLWPTSWLRALGQSERLAIESLTDWWPERRAILLTHRDALELSCDNPDHEAATVQERLKSLLPEGWTLLTEEQLDDWLSALVQDELELDLFSEKLFAFTNRRRDRVRILVWERSGFVLWMKRLERERFHWRAPTQRW